MKKCRQIKYHQSIRRKIIKHQTTRNSNDALSIGCIFNTPLKRNYYFVCQPKLSRMKPLSVFILLSIALSSYSQSKIQIDSSVTITISYKYNTDASLFNALHKMNNNIVYTAVLYPSEQNKPSLFAVSKYEFDNSTSIDSAFNQSVRHVPDGAQNGYELVDFSTYKKDDNLLRFKESKLTFSDGSEMYNLMYYFMKEGSGRLYEIKTTGAKESVEQNKKMLEEIATSFKFQ